MIKIQYCEKEKVEKWHLEYVRARIEKSAVDMKNTSPGWEALEYLQKGYTSQESEEIIRKIAVGEDLDELIKLQGEWSVLAGDGISATVRELLNYEGFNHGLKVKCGQEERTWNRRALMMSTNTRVCPYCGRQYITPLKENVTASCDHYYPKECFPLLSINMYNLIPCCHICNSVFKGDKVRGKKDLHLYPYADATETLKFRVRTEDADSVYNISADKNYIEIGITDSADQSRALRAGNSCQLFHLPEVYQYHAKEAYELRRALKEENSEAYQEMFKKNFRQLEVIHGRAFSYRSTEVTDEPLVKFRRDIEEQFKVEGIKGRIK